MSAPVSPGPPVLDGPAARRPIVFWGPKASGKTTYIARMLLRPDELDDAAEWQVTPADARTADYAADILETLRRDGSVRPTLVTENPFWFKLQRRREVLRVQRVTEWDLIVLDPKGEVFLRNRLSQSDDALVLRLVAQAHGIVLLVDPTAPNAASAYWDMFADNIHEFVAAMRAGAERGRTLDRMNRILVPAAICLTKMDNFPEHGDALAFLKTRLGAAYDLIHRSFVTYRVFSCSALGDAGADARPRRPWGLLPPLEWLTAAQRGRLLPW